MPKKSEPFTESYIKNLPIPDTGDYAKSDRGLKVRVYATGAKVWSYFKHAPNGIRKTIPLGEYPSISVRQARELADRNLGEMLKTGHDIATNKVSMTFGEYITGSDYQSWSKSNRKSHREIMTNLRQTTPSWFVSKPLNVFVRADFQRFVDGRLGEGVKPQTINRNLNNIKSVFRHAYENEVIKDNPAGRFKPLKDAEPKEKLSLTEDERLRLLKVARDKTFEQADKRAYMEFFVELGIYCGLRYSEIINLKWKDFVCPSLNTFEIPDEVFKDGRTRLFQTMKTITGITIDKINNTTKADYAEQGKLAWHIYLGGEDTKSSKGRKVPVPTHLVKRIREYLWVREENNIAKKYKDYVFPDESLNVVRRDHATAMGVFDDIEIIPHKNVDRAWQTIHKLAGLPKIVSIHTLRHDFCTERIKQGVDVYTVKRLAGHADIRTTMRYVHALEDTDFDALNSLEYNYLTDPE